MPGSDLTLCDSGVAFARTTSARDPAAAEAEVVLVEDDGLAGCDGTELVREGDARAVAVERRHGGGVTVAATSAMRERRLQRGVGRMIDSKLEVFAQG